MHRIMRVCVLHIVFFIRNDETCKNLKPIMVFFFIFDCAEQKNRYVFVVVRYVSEEKNI